MTSIYLLVYNVTLFSVLLPHFHLPESCIYGDINSRGLIRWRHLQVVKATCHSTESWRSEEASMTSTEWRHLVETKQLAFHCLATLASFIAAIYGPLFPFPVPPSYSKNSGLNVVHAGDSYFGSIFRLSAAECMAKHRSSFEVAWCSYTQRCIKFKRTEVIKDIIQ